MQITLEIDLAKTTELRNDKTVADTMAKVQEQFDSAVR